MRKDLLDLITSSLPDLAHLFYAPTHGRARPSWFENPKKLACHHRRRRRAARARKALRRVRRARGQNPRTGSRRK